MSKRSNKKNKNRQPQGSTVKIPVPNKQAQVVKARKLIDNIGKLALVMNDEEYDAIGRIMLHCVDRLAKEDVQRQEDAAFLKALEEAPEGVPPGVQEKMLAELEEKEDPDDDHTKAN